MAASTNLTPSQRSQRARIAAYAKHAKHDPKESTEAARKAFLNGFESEAALKQHMASLALKSSKARGRRDV
jgi:hypothetical protein